MGMKLQIPWDEATTIMLDALKDKYPLIHEQDMTEMWLMKEGTEGPHHVAETPDFLELRRLGGK